jgi:hypothetical protein
MQRCTTSFVNLESRTTGELRRDGFDTATPAECWRTGPYLPDGSAVTLEDVLTTRNPEDEHGHTSHLTPAEIQDLVTYVLSL